MSLCVEDHLAMVHSAYTHYHALSTMSLIWFVTVVAADESYFGIAETIWIDYMMTISASS
jgi:hypothetical protein